MKNAGIFLLLVMLMGCAETQPNPNVFVQGNINIFLPVTKDPDGTSGIFSDGGTLSFAVKDATGQSFMIFEDHRIKTKTPGAIYLNAHPNEPDTIYIKNQADFRRRVKFN